MRPEHPYGAICTRARLETLFLSCALIMGELSIHTKSYDVGGVKVPELWDVYCTER